MYRLPSKRRKYNNDDEKLEKFLECFEGRESKDEQGSNISTLFIREYYYHLCNIIFENENIHHWRITGNLGIGKTFFSYYLPYFLSQQHKTVVYHKLNKSLILFSEKGHVDNIHTFKDYLGNKEDRDTLAFKKESEKLTAHKVFDISVDYLYATWRYFNVVGLGIDSDISGTSSDINDTYYLINIDIVEHSPSYVSPTDEDEQ
ncbi:42610_t:CDS:2, partial [Gigaspora margarita]